MASAFLLIFASCLLFAEGLGAELPRDAELPRQVGAETPATRIPGEGRATTGPVQARRELSAQLGATASPVPVKGAVHPKDAAALQKVAARWRKDIKNGSAVDDRRLLATWDVKRPCSQWYGITCDSATHRVTAIKLPGLGGDAPFFRLSGPLPAELGSLPELRSLILARNKFRGGEPPFPNEWARLGKLSHLDLSAIKGGGGDVFAPLPLALCNLTSLTYLNLADRPFEGLPNEFKRLSRLAWLDLSAGGFAVRGNDLQILGSLTRLKSLFLRASSVSSWDLESLRTLRGLEQLDLSDNLLSEGFPSFVKGLTRLADLRLGRIVCCFTAVSVPAWLVSLGRLTSLDLTGNALTSLPRLGGLSRLARLILRENRLAGKVPQELLNSPSLTHLDLSYNNLNLSGIAFGPRASSKLKRLDLSRNNATGTISSASGIISSASGPIPKGLSGLTRLESLSHSGNGLTGAVPPFLWARPTLTQLDLSDNRLTGLGFSSQQNRAMQLRRLNLSRNRFQGPIPGGWSALTRLTALSLSGNRLTGTVPDWLWRVRGLAALDLSGNLLTGTIPTRWSALTSLTALSISDNKITGPIPEALQALKALVSLNLSSNSLTGRIPDKLGALKWLVALDLGSNRLTGGLPGSLFRPRRVLRVASNQLGGALPATAVSLVMRTLEAAFFGYNIPGESTDVSGNYLTGLCYGWLVERFLRCPLDLQTCLDIATQKLAGLRGNCLQAKGCNGTSYGAPPAQRSIAECSRFCGSDEPNGSCNGHGFCTLQGPKKTPTCTCSKGFSAPASQPGTCMRAP